MNIYFLMALGGLLGIIIHAIKSIGAINKRTEGVKFKDVFKIYWTSEWLSFLSSFVLFAALLFVSSEFIDLNKIDTPDIREPLKERLLHFKLSSFIKTASIIGGYFCDSIVYGFLGVTEGRIKTFLEGSTNDKKP